MATEAPKYRRSLSDKQLSLLHVLYRFRFATTDLIARYQGKRNSAIVYPRLINLVEQGYVGRNYDPSYRKQDKPATYYLLPAGIKALKKWSAHTYNAKTLHNFYRDKTATDDFITQCLEVFDTYCSLKAVYSDRLQFFTKTDLASLAHDYFPDPLPDAYLRLDVGGTVRQYFLDVHHEQRPFFLATRRLKQYAAYADNGAWGRTGTELPELLALCDNTSLQRRLQKKIAKSTNRLSFLLTAKELVQQAADNPAIWQPYDRPDQAVELGLA